MWNVDENSVRSVGVISGILQFSVAPHCPDPLASCSFLKMIPWLYEQHWIECIVPPVHSIIFRPFRLALWYSMLPFTLRLGSSTQACDVFAVFPSDA